MTSICVVKPQQSTAMLALRSDRMFVVLARALPRTASHLRTLLLTPRRYLQHHNGHSCYLTRRYLHHNGHSCCLTNCTYYCTILSLQCLQRCLSVPVLPHAAFALPCLVQRHAPRTRRYPLCRTTVTPTPCTTRLRRACGPGRWVKCRPTTRSGLRSQRVRAHEGGGSTLSRGVLVLSHFRWLRGSTCRVNVSVFGGPKVQAL